MQQPTIIGEASSSNSGQEKRFITAATLLHTWAMPINQ
jgi:hypothetical protein